MTHSVIQYVYPVYKTIMYLLGYDIGTSSVKASLVDALTGECIASASAPYSEAPIKSLQPGWAEQPPHSWWEYIKDVTLLLNKKSGINPADIKAIGLSYQMHGLVCIDKNRNVLRDAIIWCDSRGVPYGEKASKDVGEGKCLDHLLNLPGNFTATKLAWVKDHEPGIFERIYKVMLPADYIAMLMTGDICTTPGGLSEYMLWDFKENSPARFLIDYFGYNQDIFPDVCHCFSEQGKLSAGAAKILGLAPGIPVTYKAGDQPNNAVSLNVFNPGEIASTAGTSGVVYGIKSNIICDPQSRVNCFAHVNHTNENPRIGIMTCINGTGILNAWLRKNIVSKGVSYPMMNDLASEVNVGSEGISILPFGNGSERIIRNRQICCSMLGIDFNRHDQRHIIRAAQEGIVFSFMYGIEIMKNAGMSVDNIHAGNANMFLSPVFRETLANVTGAAIKLFDTDGAAGAARAAGIGAGIYADNKEAFASLTQIREIEPDLKAYDATNEAYTLWKSRLLQQLQ